MNGAEFQANKKIQVEAGYGQANTKRRGHIC